MYVRILLLIVDQVFLCKELAHDLYLPPQDRDEVDDETTLPRRYLFTRKLKKILEKRTLDDKIIMVIWQNLNVTTETQN